MRIIFVRHADPDYSIDSITEKGVAEAQALNRRILTWKDDIDYYCSMLGRDKLTCEIALNDTGREAVTLDWLKEFDVLVKDWNGARRVPWDFLPSHWTEDEKLLSYDKWSKADIMKTGNVAEEYDRVVKCFDELLEGYGYKRNKKYYRYTVHSEKTLVLFCPMGMAFMLMSHLMNMSPISMIHGMCMLPCSLSIFQSEERERGIASFRASVIGDTTHLHMAGEPLSDVGYFGKAFRD
ncbi:MAG: histidine phosphatase family protein [Ruminococcus sp.]|nr:histidine phosphatase family protein [Ruminococcus sp.]